MQEKLKFISLILCLSLVTGCAAKTKKIVPVRPKHFPYVKTSQPGIYHTIKRGETLWRISRIYAVDLNELTRFNKISNVYKIEAGQKVFIPDSIRRTKTARKISKIKTDFIWPCKGEIASCFSQIKKSVKNQGIDILTRAGTNVNAAASGNVIFTSENMRGYGKAIIIQHAANFTTVYTNNKKNLVKTGDYVRQGQVIAKAGLTGRTSRCIVHFELRKNNKPQNPLLFLP